MDIISLVLMLIVAAVVWYSVTLAMAGNWRQLVMVAIGLLLALWILGALGMTLPSIPKA